MTVVSLCQQPGRITVLLLSLLLTACGGGGGSAGGSGGSSGGPAPGATVTISGTASYEFVPPNSACNGLNYPAIEVRPIRGATVQVINAATEAVLGSGVTDAAGAYAVSVTTGSAVYVSIRAELKQVGAPSWDVVVRDNTSNTGVALEQRPPYVLDGSSFDPEGTNQRRNLLATTGWNGAAYLGPRAAAPFAILDTVYTAMQLVLSADSTTTFPPLDVFWSKDNSTAPGTGDLDQDIANGDISTSYYRSDKKLFLLGMADDDTDEFDQHVIVHEWGHYFEDAFSRSDSTGGSHGTGDRLDMRLAFSEGWATAYSGMALDSPQYCDTGSVNQARGFSIDIESTSPSPRGWFNEFSIMALIFDLWDDNNDILKGDSGSIGFVPIFNTMVNRQSVTEAHASIFTFIEELRNEWPSSAALADNLRGYHNINGTGLYGEGETNHGFSATPQDALPVYTGIIPDGTPVNVCVNNEHDNGGANGNKLSQHHFLRFAVTTPARYAFSIQADAATMAVLPADDPANDADQSDPDSWVYRNGQAVALGGSGDANSEVFNSFEVLAVGNYVMDITEFRFTDDPPLTGFPDRVCFDVTVQPGL